MAHSVAVLMLVDTSEPPEEPWRPNWRVARRLVLCVVCLVAGLIVSGAIGAILVFTSVLAGFDAALCALPYMHGLGEHKQ